LFFIFGKPVFIRQERKPDSAPLSIKLNGRRAVEKFIANRSPVIRR
jgi:hypothetical protein